MRGFRKKKESWRAIDVLYRYYKASLFRGSSAYTANTAHCIDIRSDFHIYLYSIAFSNMYNSPANNI